MQIVDVAVDHLRKVGQNYMAYLLLVAIDHQMINDFYFLISNTIQFNTIQYNSIQFNSIQFSLTFIPFAISFSLSLLSLQHPFDGPLSSLEKISSTKANDNIIHHHYY